MALIGIRATATAKLGRGGVGWWRDRRQGTAAATATFRLGDLGFVVCAVLVVTVA